MCLPFPFLKIHICFARGAEIQIKKELAFLRLLLLYVRGEKGTWGVNAPLVCFPFALRATRLALWLVRLQSVKNLLNAFSHLRCSETQQMQKALRYTINCPSKSGHPYWHSLMGTWSKQRQIQRHSTQRRSLILVQRIHEDVSLLQFFGLCLAIIPLFPSSVLSVSLPVWR